MAVHEEPTGEERGRAVADRVPTLIVCFVLAPLILYAALAATPPLAVEVAAGALAGLVSGPINPLYETIYPEPDSAPDARAGLRGPPGARDGWHPVRDGAGRLAVAGLGLSPTITAGDVIYAGGDVEHVLPAGASPAGRPGETVTGR
jgi:hypothetical protein